MMSRKGHALARSFPSLQGPSSQIAHQHMFTQDLAQGIAPLNLGRSQTAAAQYILVGKDVAAGEAILKQLARYDRRVHTELVCDVINNIAGSLFYFGRCVYQISKSQDNSIQISQVIPKRLFSLFGFYLQFVPKADFEYFQRRCLYSSSKNVWEVGLPPDFGGFLRYRIAHDMLRFADRVVPRFATENLMTNEIEFSATNYSKARIHFISDVVRRYFWKQRSMVNDHISEFYLVHRYLKEKLSKSRTRLYLVSELNRLFEKLQLDLKIEEAELPLPSDYEALLQDISDGKKPFKCFNELDNNL